MSGHPIVDTTPEPSFREGHSAFDFGRREYLERSAIRQDFDSPVRSALIGGRAERRTVKVPPPRMGAFVFALLVGLAVMALAALR